MPEKIRCPKCGDENYSTDTVCMSCGTPLKPEKTGTGQSDEATGGEPKGATAPTTRSANGEKSPGGMPPLLKAILVSVGAGILESLIVVFTREEPGITTAFGVGVQGAAGVMIFGLIYGAVRGGMIGFLVKQMGWSSTIAALLGAGIGFIPYGFFIVTGAIVGFVVGIMVEQEPATPETKRRHGRTQLRR